jgi:hypothetical protein
MCTHPAGSGSGSGGGGFNRGGGGGNPEDYGHYIEEEGLDDMEDSGMQGDEGQDVPIHLVGEGVESSF